MNVFQLRQDIRKVGFNYGLPVWIVDCGPGTSYRPEDAIRKLGTMGLHKGQWVSILRGMSEKGIGIFVDALKYVGCMVEMEANGYDETPAWFTKADRWTVYWTPSSKFNYKALRKGRDILIGTSQEFLDVMATNDMFDKGYLGEIPLDKVFVSQIRVYGVPQEK